VCLLFLQCLVFLKLFRVCVVFGMFGVLCVVVLFCVFVVFVFLLVSCVSFCCDGVVCLLFEVWWFMFGFVF
jgi:hypothetical protein